MSPFFAGFTTALNIPSIIAVLIAGTISGYTIGYSHRVTSTPITPTLVVLLANLLMFGLQISTFVGSAFNNAAGTQHSLGGHAGYLILSLMDALACGLGVVISQKGHRYERT